MTALLDPSPHNAAIAVAMLRALVVADLVDSTALVERLGDQRAAELLRAHDRLARQLIHQHGGQEIDKTDGFLLIFERPVQAVGFALAYQRGLRELSLHSGESLRARVGIHVGEVMVWGNPADDIARGAKKVEVEGLAKPIAARLMGLAMPGQILMSATAHGLAHRAADDLGATSDKIRWKSHGNYRLKGVADPIPVFEIGEIDIAPFTAPAWTGKAHRETPFWRRPVAVVAEVSVALGLLVVLLWQTLQPPPAIAFVQRDWVVMADLHNLTGDARFDQSLALATRVMMEQSKHVNVLSQQRVADSLQRMGREHSAPLDTQLAAEVAQREGARAVLLPTIRGAGSGYEYSIEVIDPLSSRAVYTERAPAASPAEVLGAVGEASDRVRLRLGEALQRIEQTSAPVPQVTSSSLDAVRAYALGLEQYNRTQFELAESHFKQALALDPEFALAIAALSRLRQVHNDLEQALALAERAHGLRDRMTNREALFLDATLAQLRFHKDGSTAWDALAELYPDYHQAVHNASLMHYMEGRYERMGEFAQRAAVPQSVTRPVSTFMTALSKLALGDSNNALKGFDEAAQMGFSSFTIEPAGALMAAGRTDEALARLRSAAAPNEFLRRKRLLAELAIHVDSGRWDRVDASHAVLRREIKKLQGSVDIASFRQMQSMRLALLGSLREPDSLAARLRGLKAMVAEALEKHAQAPLSSRSDTAMVALFLGYQLAVAGDLDAAEQLLSATDVSVAESPRAAVSDLASLLEARVALSKGDSSRALSLLDRRANGSEILLVRVLRGEALRQSGRLKEALQEANYVIANRGRGYAEWCGEGIALVQNAIELNLAHLRAAEIAIDLGDTELARSHLETLASRWSDTGGLDGVAEWLTRLRARSEHANTSAGGAPSS